MRQRRQNQKRRQEDKKERVQLHEREREKALLHLQREGIATNIWNV